MARSCTICTRVDAGTINELLHGGRSARSVAGELGVSHRALLRHAQNHVGKPSRAGTATGNGPVRPGDPLDELTAVLRERALAGSDSASREYRLALLAQQAARHATAPVAALEDAAEWVELRTAILVALEPFPDARQAVADALGES